MTKYIDGLNRIVWGAPALVLIVGVGLYLSLRLRFAQLTLFPRAWRRFLSMLRPGQKSGNGVTPFQALSAGGFVSGTTRIEPVWAA